MMSKIYFQGAFGAYSHLAALSIDGSWDELSQGCGNLDFLKKPSELR